MDAAGHSDERGGGQLAAAAGSDAGDQPAAHPGAHPLLPDLHLPRCVACLVQGLCSADLLAYTRALLMPEPRPRKNGIFSPDLCSYVNFLTLCAQKFSLVSRSLSLLAQNVESIESAYAGAKNAKLRNCISTVDCVR